MGTIFICGATLYLALSVIPSVFMMGAVVIRLIRIVTERVMKVITTVRKVMRMVKIEDCLQDGFMVIYVIWIVRMVLGPGWCWYSG